MVFCLCNKKIGIYEENTVAVPYFIERLFSQEKFFGVLRHRPAEEHEAGEKNHGEQHLAEGFLRHDAHHGQADEHADDGTGERDCRRVEHEVAVESGLSLKKDDAGIDHVEGHAGGGESLFLLPAAERGVHGEDGAAHAGARREKRARRAHQKGRERMKGQRSLHTVGKYLPQK